MSPPHRDGRLADELRKRNLKLAAFAYARDGFSSAHDWELDLAGAHKAIEFVRRFPEPRLGLGGAAHPSRPNAERKLDQAIRFYNEVGRLGRSAGVSVNVHRHSHHGSPVQSAKEYAPLVGGLDPRAISFGPDTGHIVRGGQDLLDCLRKHIRRITPLPLKDGSCSLRRQAEGVYVPGTDHSLALAATRARQSP